MRELTRRALGVVLVAGLTGCSGSVAGIVSLDGGDGSPGMQADSGRDGTVVRDGAGDVTGDGAGDVTGGDAPFDGPSESGVETGTDAPAEATSESGVEASTDAADAADAVSADAGDAGEAGASCGADGTACTNGGLDGLCKAGACSACVPVTDDATCVAAYGAAHLCIAGACVPGNCRTDSNCATGQICGLSAANTCGGCTADSQCQSDATYGASSICNTTTSTCVAGTCTGANDTACTANALDVCCSAACTPGNCCDTPSCQARFGNTYACVAHTCSSCDAVGASKTYVVDPLSGSDAAGTGSATAGGVGTASCAFKTISRALAVIGPAPGAGTIIKVLNDATVGAGETFPIVVTTNVTITGVTTVAGQTTVSLAARQTGFRLVAAAASVANLTIDGGHLAGTSGVVADTGSTLTTSLVGVTVQNMATDGIQVVNAGVLTIGAGTNSQSNGSAAATASGLRISGTGTATINVAAGGLPATFNGNTAHGIEVVAAGSVTVGSAAGSTYPTAITNGNSIANVFIQQTPVPGGSPAANAISFLESTGSLTTHGVHIFGGSSLVLRNSTVLANKVDGVFITTFGAGANRNEDVSHIDLGTASTFGHNVLQAAAGQTPGPNLGAGICLNLAVNAAQTLNAAGDTFQLADCSTANPGAITRANACTGGTDIAITGGAGTTNQITTLNCTHP